MPRRIRRPSEITEMDSVISEGHYQANVKIPPIAHKVDMLVLAL